jgi:hypothetical protein
VILPPHLEPEWPAWQLYCEGKATFTEIQHLMSIDDCDDANDVLDAWESAAERMRIKAEKKAAKPAKREKEYKR